ncbi:eukaryotic translation initiation factor 3 [Verticillium alfalfae VaMs.102]|uniref:Eukaryotic translation initiation factor 3 n=1 Tax=Verticillium alfalfae (strain VaMs.102 / ATCC MYA-4576 / FGSC 10136) TaxID=526221 RepID=C9SPW4_VERA1|nr:eukaryotic translation initiation factor 3 [Verticillium alfalfae VaMs.102]EEY20829.1 eukaryotic translation initiation factor 3 [Verticillium alfalfae VaMs.102]
MSGYQNGDRRNVGDDSDVEEEALVADYKEQVQYEDGAELEQVNSMTMAQQTDDIQSRLAAAAQPLDFSAPLEVKFQSYDAYCSLFHFILNSEGTRRPRAALSRQNNNEEELQVLKENPNTWGCYSVLNVLYSLIQRSQITEQLGAMKRNEDPMAVAGEYGSKNLYRMLGYFSIIGLLRVHCLLGDFSLALKTLDDIELNKKAMFARVMAAHFTTYYYVGFSYMMMHRYSDAIRMFSHILVYVSRTKNFQKSAQYDSITKKNEQIRCPSFEELFRTACPKFISPTPPDFENPEANIDPVEHHLSIFMDEVKTNMWSPTIKSYLRLYTTMDLNKLSGFLDVKPDELRAWLLVSKQRTKQLRWSENSLLDGDLVNVSDLDYAMQNVSPARFGDGTPGRTRANQRQDLIHISEAKVGRKLVDWYLRNLSRTYT